MWFCMDVQNRCFEKQQGLCKVCVFQIFLQRRLKQNTLNMAVLYFMAETFMLVLTQV